MIATVDRRVTGAPASRLFRKNKNTNIMLGVLCSFLVSRFAPSRVFQLPRGHVASKRCHAAARRPEAGRPTARRTAVPQA